MALMSDALRCRANRATKLQNANARPTLPWGMCGRCPPRVHRSLFPCTCLTSSPCNSHVAGKPVHVHATVPKSPSPTPPTPIAAQAPLKVCACTPRHAWLVRRPQSRQLSCGLRGHGTSKELESSHRRHAATMLAWCMSEVTIGRSAGPITVLGCGRLACGVAQWRASGQACCRGSRQGQQSQGIYVCQFIKLGRGRLLVCKPVFFAEPCASRMLEAPLCPLHGVDRFI
jgi:hypothetical protein